MRWRLVLDEAYLAPPSLQPALSQPGSKGHLPPPPLLQEEESTPPKETDNAAYMVYSDYFNKSLNTKGGGRDGESRDAAPRPMLASDDGTAKLAQRAGFRGAACLYHP